MTEGANNRLGFSAVGGRKSKAEKIAAILAAAGKPLKPTDQLLDLGCGSGEIAERLSTLCNVSCMDTIDQRTHARHLPFSPTTGCLSCSDGSFDVVVSNHVIEHVEDPTAHLDEIRRVLRPHGVAYLATPNRLWPWEFHSRMPLAHYLPGQVFYRIGMALGRLHEPVRLLSLRRLKSASLQSFAFDVWHHRILQQPDRFVLELPRWLKSTLQRLPNRLLAATAALQPTLIVLLTPR